MPSLLAMAKSLKLVWRLKLFEIYCTESKKPWNLGRGLGHPGICEVRLVNLQDTRVAALERQKIGGRSNPYPIDHISKIPRKPFLVPCSLQHGTLLTELRRSCAGRI
jgi:hypothetical protein